jgi:hypothetical protein
MPAADDRMHLVVKVVAVPYTDCGRYRKRVRCGSAGRGPNSFLLCAQHHD